MTRTSDSGPRTAPLVPVVIVNDTSGENHTGCNAVIEALLALCEQHGLEVIERLTRRQILDGQAPAKCALVIVNGEGSLHHNTSQAQFFPRLLEMLDAASQPAVLINSVWDTAEFMDDATWRSMLSWVRLVSVRESLSFAALANDCIELEAGMITTPDLSFWQLTKPEVKAALDWQPPRRFVGYSDCLPAEAVTALKARLPRPLDLPLRPAQSAADFIGLLRQYSEYHTARFHGACFALMAGVPRIVTYSANCHKIEGLVADVNAAHKPSTKASSSLVLAAGEFYCKRAPQRIEAMMKQVEAIARTAGRDARPTGGLA